MRLQLRDPERQRHEQAAPLGHGEHILHQLPEGLHLGPAELIDRAVRCPVLGPTADRAQDRPGDVADEHRLEPGLASADQRQRGRHPGERAEAVEEIILRAEHDRGPQDRGVRHGRKHLGLAGRLAARVERGQVRVGAERRHMDQPRPGRRRGLRDVVRAFRLHRLEALLAALEQDADQVDHHVGAAHRGLHRGRVAQIGLHRVDLPDLPERLQVAREVRPAHRRADAVARARQRPHHVAAEEPGAAEYGDQRLCGDFGHRIRPLRSSAPV